MDRVLSLLRLKGCINGKLHTLICISLDMGVKISWNDLWLSLTFLQPPQVSCLELFELERGHLVYQKVVV